MVRIYCLFIFSFALLFPYITDTQNFIHHGGKFIVENIKSECKRWFLDSSIAATPLIVARDRSLTLIDVRLPGYSFQKNKAVTLVTECRSVYPVSMEVTLGQKHNNIENANKTWWESTPGSVPRVLVSSTILKISVMATVHVRIRCKQKIFAGSMVNYVSTFQFLLVYDDYRGQHELHIKPDFNQEAIYVIMAEEPQNLKICSPMQPLPVDLSWIYKTFGHTRANMDEANYGLLIAIAFYVGLMIIVIISPMCILIWRNCCKLMVESVGRNRRRRRQLCRRTTPVRRVFVVLRVYRPVMSPGAIL